MSLSASMASTVGASLSMAGSGGGDDAAQPDRLPPPPMPDGYDNPFDDQIREAVMDILEPQSGEDGVDKAGDLAATMLHQRALPAPPGVHLPSPDELGISHLGARAASQTLPSVPGFLRDSYVAAPPVSRTVVATAVSPFAMQAVSSAAPAPRTSASPLPTTTEALLAAYSEPGYAGGGLAGLMRDAMPALTTGKPTGWESVGAANQTASRMSKITPRRAAAAVAMGILSSRPATAAAATVSPRVSAASTVLSMRNAGIREQRAAVARSAAPPISAAPVSTGSEPAASRSHVVVPSARTFPYIGITRRRAGRWVAYIGHNGKQMHLGTFSTADEAAEAYDRAAKRLGLEPKNGFIGDPPKRQFSGVVQTGTQSFQALAKADNGDEIPLGVYSTAMEAAMAYDASRIRMGAAPSNGFYPEHLGINAAEAAEAARRYKAAGKARGRAGAGNYVGITRRPSGKWIAYTGISGKQVHLGTFETAEQAAKAYDEAMVRLGKAPRNGFCTTEKPEPAGLPKKAVKRKRRT